MPRPPGPRDRSLLDAGDGPDRAAPEDAAAEAGGPPGETQDAVPLVAADLPAHDATTRRWLFADQLGPHYVDDPDQEVVLVESLEVFRRKRFHRRKAHLVLSALRHRALAGGDRATLVRARTYREGLAEAGVGAASPVSVCDPTSWPARRFVRRLAAEGKVRLLGARGFVVTEGQFAHWAEQRGRRRLLLEDFYREVRRHHRLLLEPDGEPVGGAWNYDAENREPPPRAGRLADAVALPDPWWPQEDDVDAGVREDLDRMVREEGVEFLGDDGPRRFAVTREEALTAVRHFLRHRLEHFGAFEDAMLAGDRWMAHSLVSAPQNLGLLHPLELAREAERAHREHGVRLASVEGFVRQVVGWREYVWHLYWHLGEDYRESSELGARTPLPSWFADLDPRGEVHMRCLSDVLASVREEGWAHHIPRLMVLGNWALQRGYDPRAVTDWFHRAFVDGYDWVMVANVVGMATHGDGGRMMTKPYAGGGAYVDRMSDYCGGCRYDPRVRVGEHACPFTAGYWAFLHRHRERFDGNHRMRQQTRGLGRLRDLDALLEQERERDAGQSPP